MTDAGLIPDSITFTSLDHTQFQSRKHGAFSMQPAQDFTENQMLYQGLVLPNIEVIKVIRDLILQS